MSTIRDKLSSLRFRLATAWWVWSYSLEERRELHSLRNQHLRAAWCCLGQAVVNIFRGRL